MEAFLLDIVLIIIPVNYRFSAIESNTLDVFRFRVVAERLSFFSKKVLVSLVMP